MKPLKCSEIDPQKIRISKVCPPFKTGTKEITKIELEYGNQPLYIMGPKLYCPFGLSQLPKKEEVQKYTKVKYTVQMNFKGQKEGFENAESTEALYNLFEELDLKLIELLLEKSGEFLNQQTTEYSLIDKMYQRIIKTPEKEEYDKFFRLKLPTNFKNPTEFSTGFFDENQKPLKLNTTNLDKHIEERRWIRPIIKLDCLWYIEGKLYPNIEGHLLKIYSEIEKKPEKKQEKSDHSKSKKSKTTNKPIEFL